MNKLRVALSFACLFSPGLFAQDLPPQKSMILEEAESFAPEIGRMTLELWEHSETALKEHASSALLVDVLKNEGFQVETGVAGMPTAFVASYGEGKPILGILAEYDALPGVGNEAVPHREARADGVTSGHGCGHNLFAAGSVGAAVVIKRAMAEHRIPGTVRLYGCPAEETLVGKVYMAKEGLFDDVDAVIDWHAGLETKISNTQTRAMNNFQVEFFGQAAHSSTDPWNGRSALDAVELMNYGVNMMREHVQPTARTHYVIPDAGLAPNVVPDYARVWYYTREVNREAVDKNYQWILNIAKAAALATRTEHKTFLITGVHSYNLNRPLQEAAQKHLERVGAPTFTEEEVAFAKALQRTLGREEVGYDTKVYPLADEPEPVSGGSTDVAEVSWIAPTMSARVTSAAANIPWHSWATAACHGTSAAPKAAVVAAKVLGLTGIDVLTDADLRERARAAFLEQTGGRPYQSPIPRDQAPPLP